MSINETTTCPEKITVLKHLIHDREPEWIAVAMSISIAQVEDIAQAYGWPDPAKMRWAIDELSGENAIPARRTPAPARISGGRAPRPAAGDPKPISTRAREVKPSASELLVAASRSSRTRTQALGVKIAGLLGDLAVRLREEERDQEERAAAEAAAAERRRHIAQLEAQQKQLADELRRLRSATRPTKVAPPLGAPAAVVRAWAKEQKLPCPVHGKVPARVRDAYDAAHAAA